MGQRQAGNLSRPSGKRLKTIKVKLKVKHVKALTALARSRTSETPKMLFTTWTGNGSAGGRLRSFAQGDRKTPNQMRSKERRSPRSFSRYDDYERDGRYRRSRSRSYERRRSRSPSYERRPRRSDSPRDSRSYGRHRRSRSRDNDRSRHGRDHGRGHRGAPSHSRSGSRSPSPDTRIRMKSRKSRSGSRSPLPAVGEDAPQSSGAREDEDTRARSASRSCSRSVSRSHSRSRSRSWAGRKSGGH